MTDYVHRTMIVPASLVSLARGLASGLAGEAGANMWTTGISPSGSAPATAYVSTGAIGNEFVEVLTDADLMFAMTQDAGLDVSLAQCQALVGGSDVTDEEPFAAFERLGLKMIQQE